MFDENYMKMMFARKGDQSLKHEDAVKNMRAFKSFIQKVRAEAWERGYYVGYIDGANDVDDLPTNPYSGVVIKEME